MNTQDKLESLCLYKNEFAFLFDRIKLFQVAARSTDLISRCTNHDEFYSTEYVSGKPQNGTKKGDDQTYELTHCEPFLLFLSTSFNSVRIGFFDAQLTKDGSLN